MEYKINLKNPLDKEVKRIIHERIDICLKHIEVYESQLDKTVHELRKNLKKIRAVLRLLKYSIPDQHFKSLNYCYRDIARIYSPVRDARVFIDWLNILLNNNDHSRERFSATHKALQNFWQNLNSQLIRNNRIFLKTKNELSFSLSRINKLDFEDKGFNMISPGLEKVYAQGQKAFKKAKKTQDPEHLHEWRKQVKYTWYHLKLLEGIWKPVIRGYDKSLNKLSDYLGDDHDLFELKKAIHEYDQIKYIPATEKEDITKAIEIKKFEIQENIWPLAEKVYANKPDRFVKRLEKYWQSEKSKIVMA